MNSQIRIQIYLFLLAVPLHLIWKVAQISAFDFPETDLTTVTIGCFLPSLGDGLMTLVIYWAGWLGLRDWQWILHPGIREYLFMMGIGLLLAVTVEWIALYQTRAWAYKQQMIVIPILGVGLLPILQMLLLPPATAVLVQWIWRKGRENSHTWRKSPR